MQTSNLPTWMGSHHPLGPTPTTLGKHRPQVTVLRTLFYGYIYRVKASYDPPRGTVREPFYAGFVWQSFFVHLLCPAVGLRFAAAHLHVRRCCILAIFVRGPGSAALTAHILRHSRKHHQGQDCKYVNIASEATSFVRQGWS